VTLPPGCIAARSAAAKDAWLAEALEPWGEALMPIEAPPQELRWAYRDKVRLSVAWLDGAWRFGLRRKAPSTAGRKTRWFEEFVAIPGCPVHAARIHATLAALAPALPPPGDFPLHWFVQSGAQVVLVLKTARAPATGWCDAALQQRLSAAGVEGLWLHLNPSTGDRVLVSKGWELLWGSARSRDAEGLRHGPASFRQALGALHRQALDRAEQWLAPQAGDRVLDLYAGTGSSLRRWTARGAHALGVELSGEAVDCARENAPAALLLRGRCSERVPQMRDWLAATAPGGATLLYANPPRTGLELELRAWIAAEARPARIAYLSCSAGTLRRDLQGLATAGWRVASLEPYDFLPQTLHVETLALLERAAG